MKLLSYFVDRHTLPTTIVASLSGFAGVVLDHIDQATQVVAFFGACAGTLTAILGAVVMWRRAWRNEQQRRQHGTADVEAEDEDELP